MEHSNIIDTLPDICKCVCTVNNWSIYQDRKSYMQLVQLLNEMHWDSIYFPKGTKRQTNICICRSQTKIEIIHVINYIIPKKVKVLFL